MNAKKLSINLYLALFLLILVTMGLVGCGTLEVGAILADSVDASDEGKGVMEAEEDQVKGIEIGIEPPSMLTYINDFYGFKFDYPETWTLTEEEHRVVLLKGTNRLGINFHWVNEDFRGRTGVGAGDFIYSGKLIFMGQIIPVETLLYEGKDKAIFYNGTSSIEVDDLVFGIVLEDLETDYMVLDLPDDVIPEANAILESFARIEATGSNPPAAPTQEPTPTAPEELIIDTSLYENQEYGFNFLYPSFMSVVEEPNKVILNYPGTYDENLQLTIAYRRADENIHLAEIGNLTGQFHPYVEVPFLGSPVQAILNIHDGLITAVFLGGPGVELGEGTPLRFVVNLVNTDGGRISNAQVDESLRIFDSFVLASWSD
jgi:hypothetical protein